MRAVLLSVVTATALTACTSASATPPAKGYWAFVPSRCPDLVEDRRDRRESIRDEAFDRGPVDVYEDYIDRKESRRDEAVTVCPASAWVWKGGVYKAKYHPARPAAAKVYYNHKKRTYFRYGTGKKHVVVIKF